jgi:hypothetical protein
VQQSDTCLYAVMDGVFVACTSHEEMVHIIRSAFGLLAQEFVAGRGFQKMFMVRAGLAFGPTIHGRNTPGLAFFGDFGDGAAYPQEDYEQSRMPGVKNQLMLSPAMAWAHDVEHTAPPFGIFVHESAQAMPQSVAAQDRGFNSYLFRWWTSDDDSRRLASLTANQVVFYLSHARKNSLALGYSEDRIARHERMAREYFGKRWSSAEGNPEG